jgi:hypothetical protein
MSFEMFAGDTMRVNFTITDASTGNALDLFGTTVRWQMSRAKPVGFSSTPILSKMEGDGLEIVDSFGGTILVRLAPEDTEGRSGSFYHELEIIDADGDVSTAYSGTFTVNKALIKPPV